MSAAEVDAILIDQLKIWGIEVDSSVETFQDFDKNLLYRSVYEFLKIIFDEEKLVDVPPKLPVKEMAQTFKICNEVVSLIKSIGFRKEINFDFFLYPNENDSREVFSFLLEKTQKVNEKEQVGDENKYFEKMTTEERMNEKLNELVKSTWIQRTNVNNYYINLNKMKTTFISSSNAQERLISNQEKYKNNLFSSIFEDNEIKLVKQELNQQELKNEKNENLNYLKDALRISRNTKIEIKNVLKEGNTMNHNDDNDIGILNESGFNLRKKFETEESSNIGDGTTLSSGNGNSDEKLNKEEQEKKRIEEMENLNKSIEKLKKATKNIENTILKLNLNMKQMSEVLEKEKEKKINFEKSLKIIGTTQKLLENKDENIKKMKNITSSSGEHLIELAKEWEQHRVPLIQKIRKLKNDQKNLKDDYSKKLESVKKNRKLLEENVTDIKQKEDLLNKLKVDFQQLPKNVERKNYVDRIMDINKNVDKQKLEINKILLDNHLISNESNELSKKLIETFQKVEEVIYQEAQKEEYAKTLYQNIVQMREGFSSLIKLVRDGGEMNNEIRDLETSMDHLNSRNDSLNLERLVFDLNSMKKENQSLMNQLKSNKK
eukprot:gene2296-2469_t